MIFTILRSNNLKYIFCEWSDITGKRLLSLSSIYRNFIMDSGR